MNAPTRILLTAFALALPATAFAQSGSAGYCQALDAKYQRYVATNDRHYRTPTPDANVSNAMASCETNSGRAIPTLEQALRAAHLDLPPRG